MNPSSKTKIYDRRVFAHHLFWLSLGGPLILNGMPLNREQTVPGKLWDPFSPAEAETIKHSAWAKEIFRIRTEKKYNCAETVFLTALKQLDLPEDWVGAAGGFGGGMGQRGTCGLLTGGIMAIGAAGTKFYPKDRKVSQAFISGQRKDYWKWWTARSPVDCKELRAKYDGPGFERMAQRVAARLETIISQPLPG